MSPRQPRGPPLTPSAFTSIDERIAAVGSPSIWEGEKILLCAYEPEDAEAWRVLEDTADQRSGWKVWPPRSKQAEKKWCEEASEAKFENDAVEFRVAIARREDNVLVGGANVHTVDQINGTFMFGIGLRGEHKGSGYAADAVLLLMRYMFDERRFQKCESGVFSYNAASLSLHRKLGFIQEGRLRQHLFLGGELHDLVLFGMTVAEFHEQYPKLKPVL